MLPLENRLAKVRDFNLIIKHGRWVNGQFVDLKILTLAKISAYFPNKEDPETFKNQLKIAFAVGLKISKSAVKRNRVKRQLREVVRLLLKDQCLQAGHYLLFIAKPAILAKNYAEISKEIELLLAKSGILKK